MKTKNFHKKLTLNKKTIADLTNSMMGNVLGGDGEPIGISRTYDFSCLLGPSDCVTNCGTCCTCVTCNTCATYCGTCGEISCVICEN